MPAPHATTATGGSHTHHLVAGVATNDANARRIRQQLDAARTAHENLLAREQQQAHDLEERRKMQQ
ncbi:MAG: peptidase M23, partial [Komagataeibacter saccharivorans]